MVGIGVGAPLEVGRERKGRVRQTVCVREAQPCLLPVGAGEPPSRWSKERFSIVTTTMWSIPDRPGADNRTPEAWADETARASGLAATASPTVSRRNCRLESLTTD
jgi:hypothetical protein